MPLNTRIAPSPTGVIHFGTMRTAYFNWLAARSSGGYMTVRIDDTDTERNNEAHVDLIFEALDWLGLDYDFCFRQSERQRAYSSAIDFLRDNDYTTELPNGAVALKWSSDFPRSWDDLIAGTIQITDKDIEVIDGKLILMRGGDKLGQATYQFASVVDDWATDQNLIIRGTDHISNTSKQVAIWTALANAHGQGYTLPKFAHVGLIFKDKKKMSKRDGAASVMAYKAAGFDPEALLNCMLRLGWGPTVDDKSTSVLPRQRALELFLTGGKLRSSAANFDENLLASFDRKYKAMTEKMRRAA